MRILPRLLVIFAVLTACSESSVTSTDGSQLGSSDGDASITEVSGTSSTVLGDYHQSSFSQYVYFHNSEDKILISYNFFPSGTDFDQTTLTAELPCESSSASDERLSSGESAPVDSTSCATVTVSLAGATFTNDGLVFSLGSGLDVFASQFDFRINASGFVTSDTGESITVSASPVNLDAVTEALDS